MDCMSNKLQVALPVLSRGENPPEPAVALASLCQFMPACASQAHFIFGHLLIPLSSRLKWPVSAVAIMKTFLPALLLKPLGFVAAPQF